MIQCHCWMTFLETYIILITQETCREKNIFEFLWFFRFFMVFIGFIFFYFLFDLIYVQRIWEINPSIIILFLERLKSFWSKALHPKSWKNELESFSRESLSKDIIQLKLCPHKVEFHYPFLHLFSDEVMTDVNMFGSGVLDIVAAQCNGTFFLSQYIGILLKSHP